MASSLISDDERSRSSGSPAPRDLFSDDNDRDNQGASRGGRMIIRSDDEDDDDRREVSRRREDGNHEKRDMNTDDEEAEEVRKKGQDEGTHISKKVTPVVLNFNSRILTSDFGISDLF